MQIEIDRPPALQKGSPSPVIIKLLDDKAELVGSVCIYPRWGEPLRPHHFQVEVHKGGSLSPEIDIRVKI